MLFLPNSKTITCVVCKQIIIGEYIMDSWGNAAHKTHNHSPTQFCNSCHRTIEQSTVFKSNSLIDGRKLCFQCSLTKVESLIIAQKSYKNIKDIYAKFKLLNLPDFVKLHLINLHEMKQLAKSDSNFTRGLTSTKYTLLGNRRKYTYDIYVLKGLPKLEFDAVLAHEMLHVFLIENNISLPYHKMEGFCNLGSYLIYAKDKSKYGQIMLMHMEKNPDYAYGVTFREMKSLLVKSGWRELIQRIK